MFSLQRPVRRVVISVPAEFDAAQRAATTRAAQLVGLDVVRLVNEPTAASLAYGIGLVTHQSPNSQSADLRFQSGGDAVPAGGRPSEQRAASDEASATEAETDGADGTEAEHREHEGLNVVVVDLGGGTLDVALLRLQGNMFLTQALAGTRRT